MGIDGTSHAIPIPGMWSSNTKQTFPQAGISPKSRSGCSSIKATARSIKSYCGSSAHWWKKRHLGDKRHLGEKRGKLRRRTRQKETCRQRNRKTSTSTLYGYSAGIAVSLLTQGEMDKREKLRDKHARYRTLRDLITDGRAIEAIDEAIKKIKARLAPRSRLAARTVRSRCVAVGFKSSNWGKVPCMKEAVS